MFWGWSVRKNPRFIFYTSTQECKQEFLGPTWALVNPNSLHHLPPCCHLDSPNCPVSVQSPRFPLCQMVRPSSLSGLDLYWPERSTTMHNNRGRRTAFGGHLWSAVVRQRAVTSMTSIRLQQIVSHPSWPTCPHTHTPFVLELLKSPMFTTNNRHWANGRTTRTNKLVLNCHVRVI